jgi:hypothetical protein
LATGPYIMEAHPSSRFESSCEIKGVAVFESSCGKIYRVEYLPEKADFTVVVVVVVVDDLGTRGIKKQMLDRFKQSFQAIVSSDWHLWRQPFGYQSLPCKSGFIPTSRTS